MIVPFQDVCSCSSCFGCLVQEEEADNQGTEHRKAPPPGGKQDSFVCREEVALSHCVSTSSTEIQSRLVLLC